jgi:oligopeptide/dipeptide ABC transporter ATP-binding protein
MNDLESGVEAAASPAALTEPHDADVVQGVGLGKYFHQRARSFGRTVLVRAVHEATIGIARGETVGLVGESGSGKTTLGRLLLRLLEPSFGKVMFDGRDITHLLERDLRPLRRHMQLLFQDAPASLDDRMTVEQIVGEPLGIHGSAEKRPGAERERIELLGELQAARSLAYLFISHDLRLVLGSSQRVYVMYAGRIVEWASSGELRDAARHPYTRSLLHAVPEPDPQRRRLRLVLEGEPPSPFQPLIGCAFHPRCPRAQSGVCDTDAPPLAPISPESHHDVACWYPYD